MTSPTVTTTSAPVVSQYDPKNCARTVRSTARSAVPRPAAPCGVVHSRRHHDRRLQRHQRRRWSDARARASASVALNIAPATPGCASQPIAARNTATTHGRRNRQRRPDRPQYLCDEQLDGRHGRRQQRLERPRLFLADDGMRGQRHRAGNRGQQKQQQKLLQQEVLRPTALVELIGAGVTAALEAQRGRCRRSTALRSSEECRR